MEDGTEPIGTALLVDSDPDRASDARRRLETAGYTVRLAATADDALRDLGESAADVVITGIAGSAELCSQIRDLAAIGDVPLVAWSATGDPSTTLRLFALGADDVVPSSGGALEVLARVNAVLRRRRDAGITRRIGPLRVSFATGDAWLLATPLALTTGERNALLHLARVYPGVVSNLTDTIVARLRRKILAAGGGIEVRAVRRTGHVLHVPTVMTTTR